MITQRVQISTGHLSPMGLDVSLSWSGRVSEASLVRERMLKLSKELLRLDETWVQGRITSMSAFAARI